jgi:hypothetical protein
MRCHRSATVSDCEAGSGGITGEGHVDQALRDRSSTVTMGLPRLDPGSQKTSARILIENLEKVFNILIIMII